jgi:hypothetical protein
MLFGKNISEKEITSENFNLDINKNFTENHKCFTINIFKIVR